MLGYVCGATKQVTNYAVKVKDGLVQAKDYAECKFDQYASPYGFSSGSIYRFLTFKGDAALKMKVYGEELTSFFWVTGVLDHSIIFKNQAKVEDKKLDDALKFLAKELLILEELRDSLQNKNKMRA